MGFPMIITASCQHMLSFSSCSQGTKLSEREPNKKPASVKRGLAAQKLKVAQVFNLGGGGVLLSRVGITRHFLYLAAPASSRCVHRPEACATDTSALPGLTTGFGMGSGVAPEAASNDFICDKPCSGVESP